MLENCYNRADAGRIGKGITCVCVRVCGGEGEGEEVVAVLPGGACGASVFKRRHRSLKGQQFTRSPKACHRTCLHSMPLADLWWR